MIELSKKALSDKNERNHSSRPCPAENGLGAEDKVEPDGEDLM